MVVGMEDVTYLLDKSAWVQTRHSTTAAAEVAAMIRRGRLAMSTPTALEVLYSARNKREYERDHQRLAALPWFDLTLARDAVALQRTLAARGWHRLPLPDVVIAATAREHGLTVLHYDGDYERIAKVAEISHRWIVPRGEGHQSDGEPPGT